MTPPPVGCLICGKRLEPAQLARSDRFCGVVCRAAHARFLPHQLCQVCGRPLSPVDLAGRACGGAAPCRQIKAQAEAAEREARQAEAIAAEAERLRAAGIRSLEIVDPDSYPTTIIPYNPRPFGAVEERRLKLFRKHLVTVITKAVARPELDGHPPLHPAIVDPRLDEPAPPAMQAVFGQACALCRGACCRRGDEHAYLTPDTIRRIRREYPGLTLRALFNAYFDNLPAQIHQGSCVFHGPTGCPLPSSMRSDTCNRYFCPELLIYRLGQPEGAPPRAFLVPAHDGVIENAAFVDGRQSREVPKPPAPAPLPDDPVPPPIL